jgi:hypothetical protein
LKPSKHLEEFHKRLDDFKTELDRLSRMQEEEIELRERAEKERLHQEAIRKFE